MNNIKVSTEMLPYKRRWPKILLIIVLIIILILIIFYPYEAGILIGKWISEFKSGFEYKNINYIWEIW